MLKWMTRTFFLTLLTSLIIGILFIAKKGKETSHTSLDVFCWGQFIPEALIEKFEREHHIKVNVHSYNSNEELIIKLKNGSQKYDIIFPSDYAVRQLIHNHLLSPLDHSRLQKIARPSFLGQNYDPHNTYSFPFSWEADILAIHEKVCPKDTSTIDYDWIFTKHHNFKIITSSDPWENFHFASFYLFGHKNHLTPAEIKQVRHLLKQQKQLIEAYCDYRGKYLLTKEHCLSGIIKTTLLDQIHDENQRVLFVIPKSGTHISIENIAIPASSKAKKEDIYLFIEFLYRPENMAMHIDATGMFPIYNNISQYTIKRSQLFWDTYYQIVHQTPMHFYEHIADAQTVREIWIDVKS